MMDRAALAKEIKTRVPLSSIVKTVVELRGRGDSFIGLCPFHEEKTPSFNVRDRVARFKCFGCGASGDVIEFIMRLRGISFNEAVADLAHKAGIEESFQGTVKKLVPPKARNLLDAQKIAQVYFLLQLKEPRGQEARTYLLKDRGLSDKMIEQAGIGFAGMSNQNFIAYLAKHGVSLKLAIEAGLLKQGSSSPALPFLSRITFPIRNFEGEIIAFGARSFLKNADDGPKYVNTHSYAHYEKRKNFYGLYESKGAILKGVPPILVEGYFDAMAIWALGMPALALCGTALSSDHVAILLRLSARVSICYDRDSAGHLALKKSLIELFRKNINPNLILLEEKDPGDYLAAHNLSALKALVSAPVDALCHVIERAALLAKASVNDRVNQIDDLLPIFACIKRPLVRRQYVAFLAKTLHEDPALLWLEIERRMKLEKSRRPDELLERQKRLLSVTSHERLMMEIILTMPSLYKDMSEVLSECSDYVRILLEVITQVLKNGSVDHFVEELKIAVNNVDRVLWPVVEEVLLNRTNLSKEQAEQSLLALKTKIGGRIGKEALKKKRQEMHALEKKGDFSSVLRNLKEQSAILMARKKMPAHHGTLGAVLPTANAVEQKSSKVLIIKDKDISGLDGIGFFDASEDWL